MGLSPHLFVRIVGLSPHLINKLPLNFHLGGFFFKFCFVFIWGGGIF